MRRILLLLLLLLAHPPFHASISSLSGPEQAQLRSRWWDSSCPVPLSQMRLLTVSYWGFDGRTHTGELVVNSSAAAPLAKVFRRLYKLEFPIRHLRFVDAYGPPHSAPADGDVSGSFECKGAVPSPCSGGNSTGGWSEHAYGEAVDLNPVENPYTGCGRAHDPRGLKYLDRARLRRGMITPEVVRAFKSIGWGWGGDWSGSTKDYTHFSASGS